MITTNLYNVIVGDQEWKIPRLSTIYSTLHKSLITSVKETPQDLANTLSPYLQNVVQLKIGCYPDYNVEENNILLYTYYRNDDDENSPPVLTINLRALNLDDQLWLPRLCHKLITKWLPTIVHKFDPAIVFDALMNMSSQRPKKRVRVKLPSPPPLQGPLAPLAPQPQRGNVVSEPQLELTLWQPDGSHQDFVLRPQGNRKRKGRK